MGERKNVISFVLYEFIDQIIWNTTDPSSYCKMKGMSFIAEFSHTDSFWSSYPPGQITNLFIPALCQITNLPTTCLNLIDPAAHVSHYEFEVNSFKTNTCR